MTEEKLATGITFYSSMICGQLEVYKTVFGEEELKKITYDSEKTKIDYIKLIKRIGELEGNNRGEEKLIKLVDKVKDNLLQIKVCYATMEHIGEDELQIVTYIDKEILKNIEQLKKRIIEV